MIMIYDDDDDTISELLYIHSESEEHVNSEMVCELTHVMQL